MTDAPSSSRRRLPIVALLVVLAVAAGAYLAWDTFLRGDDVAPIGFSSPSPEASSPTGASSEPSAEASPATSSVASSAPASAPSAGPSSGSGAAADPAGLTGGWTVSQGSVVGYRVREKLGPVTAETDAVGRTEEVTGSATLAAGGAGVVVTEASFEADVTTLASDEGRRDDRIRTMGLESASYPSATFVLTAPVTVPAETLDGATVEVVLAGDLTIHGVTKAVSIPAQARLAEGSIEVVGSLTFPFSDFGMTPPSVGTFVTVAEDATLEFRLVLAKV